MYIKPSRYGYSYAVFLLVMLVGVIHFNNSVGYLFVFVLLSLGLVSILYAYHNLKHIEIKNVSAEKIFSQQQATLALHVSNQHDQHAFKVDFAQQTNTGNSGLLFKQEHHLGHYQSLPAKQTTLVKFSLTPPKRGWLTLKPMRISSLFPLGLFQCWRYQTPTQSVLVYPKPEGHLDIPTNAWQGAGKEDSAKEGQDDFIGLKRYREGDSLNKIAWKAVARDGEMHSKQFGEQAGEQLILCMQDTPEHWHIERRLSQLCQWVLKAEQQGLVYGLKLVEQYFEPNKGRVHLHQCLKALALYG